MQFFATFVFFKKQIWINSCQNEIMEKLWLWLSSVCAKYIKKPYFCKTHLCGRNDFFFFYLKHKTVCSTLFNRPIHHNHRLLYKLQPRQNVFINEWFSKTLFPPFKIKKKRKINHECFFLLDEEAFFSIKKKIIST